MEGYEYHKKENTLLVILKGKTNTQEMFELAKKLEDELVAPELQRVVVDLSHVLLMNTTGLNLLVRIRKKSAGLGVSFFLQSPSQQVRKVLKLVQLNSFFSYLPSEESVSPVS